MNELNYHAPGHNIYCPTQPPHRRNAINRATANALGEAWRVFDADESLRAGIFTGSDNVFCAGADLKEIDEVHM